VVAGGAEDVVYQYSVSGKLLGEKPCNLIFAIHSFIFFYFFAASSSSSLSQIYDCAEYHHADDIVGSAIVFSGVGDSIALFTAIGRAPILLKMR
jgi:hypothetical protein